MERFGIFKLAKKLFIPVAQVSKKLSTQVLGLVVSKTGKTSRKGDVDVRFVESMHNLSFESDILR